MWPDRVSNPGPLTYESGALPTGLRCPTDIFSNFGTSVKYYQVISITPLQFLRNNALW